MNTTLYPVVNRLLLLGVFVVCTMGVRLSAQQEHPQYEKVVQFSGKVITEENDRPVFVPYAVVAVKGTNRGTYTDFSGFFSIAVRAKETLVFSVLGFKDAYYTIPDTLTEDRYTIYQIIYKDTILLPEAVIYPWPSPGISFNHEFLAMDVHDDLEDIAAENLSDKALDELREYLPSDGIEHQSLYFKTKSQSYYYEGQIRPVNLFNAFAWKEFVQAWKRGDFKAKKKE